VEELDRAHVRLAELVAALSLGIDLGFGQPMEHVLRQCLIALRLGERLGLADAERAVVYYTALLVGVGSHRRARAAEVDSEEGFSSCLLGLADPWSPESERVVWASHLP
jgi:hypothetical protein